MSNKKLAILGILAVVLVVAAVMQSQMAQEKAPEPQGPAYLLQGLDPDKVASIELGAGGDKVTLKRGGRGFAVTNKDNYPAKTSGINELITSVLEIKTMETFTDNPSNHPYLGVTEEKAASAVSFYDGSGELIAGVIIGDSTEGGNAYARLVGSDTVYLIEKKPYLRTSAGDYIEKSLFSAEKQKIEEVEVEFPGENYNIAKNEDGGIALTNVPEGREVKQTEVESVFNALTSMRFEEVSAAGKDTSLDFDGSFVCTLDDSTVYTVKTADKDDSVYITATAEFTDTEPVTKEQGVESEEELRKKEEKLLARDAAEEFAKMHRNWVYKLSSWQGEKLRKPLEDLLEEPEEPEEQTEDQFPTETE